MTELKSALLDELKELNPSCTIHMDSDEFIWIVRPDGDLTFYIPSWCTFRKIEDLKCPLNETSLRHLYCVEDGLNNGLNNGDFVGTILVR